MKSTVCACAALLALGVGPVLAGTLEIAAPWLNQPPPGRAGAALYMELHNAGEVPLAVLGARVAGADSAAIHGHRHDGGMMRMHAVPRLDIAPGASVRLQPGGYHLMVGGLHAALQPGDVLPFCLRLDDGAEQCAEALVRGLGD